MSHDSSAGNGVNGVAGTGGSNAASDTFPFETIGPGQPSRLAQYRLNRVIGEGAYAAVYIATYIPDDMTCAVKKLRIFNMKQSDRHQRITETRILQRIDNAYIIKCYDAFIEGDDLYMILEYADNGDLSQLIERFQSQRLRMSETDLWRFAYCVASGLAHLHANRIIHRDIKPANIYLNQAGQVKVGDLGLGRQFAEMSLHATESVVGTPYYMSPELIQGQPYSYATDLWSFGCLLYELCQLTVPFNATSLTQLGENIITCNYQPVDTIYSMELRELVNKCLQPHQVRPTAQDIADTAMYILRHINEQYNTQQLQQQQQVQVAAAATGGADLINGNPFDDYEQLSVLGRGKFSWVYKARHRQTAERVAVKKLQIFDMDGSARHECVNEAHILQTLPDHPNIIKYMQSYIFENDLYLVFELAESGDLAGLIEAARNAKQTLSELDVWTFFTQISDALELMHRCRVMHRDIKPSNVFLTGDRRTVKLGDLGFGRYLSNQTYETFSVVGTPLYMAPEVMWSSTTGYSFASDIWSLGCLLYELCTLQSPFYQSTTNYLSLGYRTKSGQYPPLPQDWSPQMHSIIAHMIRPNPDERPTIDVVLQFARTALQQCKQAQQQSNQTTTSSVSSTPSVSI